MDTSQQLPENFTLELIISAVQELVDQLSILKIIYNWPDEEVGDFRYLSLEERFGETESQTKSAKNFNCILIIATRLLEELKNEKGFIKFTEIVCALQKMKSDEENLLQEVENKKNTIEQLKTFVDNEQMVYIEKTMSTIANIGKVKDELENFQIESEIKLNYIQSLQNSKLEMNEIKLSNKIEDETKKINTTKIKIDQDIRVHKEMETAMGEMINELETKVKEWEDKYSEKLKEMNEKLDVLYGKHNKQLEIIANFKELYSKRQQEIEDYKQYKIEQEILRKEMEKRNKAATKIQAWWRGTMVRKGFGKYRKKKEKKGKKKSSEKKENK